MQASTLTAEVLRKDKLIINKDNFTSQDWVGWHENAGTYIHYKITLSFHVYLDCSQCVHAPHRVQTGLNYGILLSPLKLS